MSAEPAILFDRPTGPTDERNCYTCASSPRWPNPAGCDQLNGGDGDEPICDYCEASGANDEDNPRPGWPHLRALICPAWTPRGRQ